MKFEFHKTISLRVPGGMIVSRPAGLKTAAKPISPTARFILGTGAILLLLLNGYQFRNEYLLRHYGVTGQAQVTSTYWGSNKGGRYYRARYRFVIPTGEQFSGKGRISVGP